MEKTVKIKLGDKIVERSIITTMTDFFGNKQKGQWIKIAHAYFPVSKLKNYIYSKKPLVYDADKMVKESLR